MMSSFVVKIWMICQIAHISKTFALIPIYKHRSVNLTPYNNNIDGASINILNNSNKVTINDFKHQWEIVSKSNKWFMKLHLNESWGFNKYFGSTINITFDSPTKAGSLTYNGLCIGITIPNTNKYIVIGLPYDDLHRIIPSCDTSNTPTASMLEGNLSQILHTNNYYHYMQPNAGINNDEKIEFPMSITLINYPKFSQNYGHYFYIQYTSSVFQSDFKQQCGFVPFDTEKGLDIYFGFHSFDSGHFASSSEQLLALKSFSISYTDDQITDPTSMPTNSPITMEQSSDDNIATLWNKYLGLWIIVIVFCMTCIMGFMLLYFSKYDSKHAQNSQKQSNVVNRHTNNKKRFNDNEGYKIGRLGSEYITVRAVSPEYSWTNDDEVSSSLQSDTN